MRAGTILSLLLLGGHAFVYRTFLADDALISLRYAHRLIEGHGLTWTDGERVEGYSNLLWTLLAAALGAVGLDLVVAIRVLGALACMVAVVFVARAARRDGDVAAFVAAASFALAGTTGVWTLAGLEAPLVAALLAVAFAVSSVRARGAALALLVWTRADGLLFALVFALAAGISARRRERELGWTLGPALAAVVAQLAFRQVTYGAWAPNTAHVKVALTTDRLVEGIAYVGAGLVALAPLVVVGVIGIVLAWRRGDERARALALVGCAWTAYVAVIGGDVFPGFRHFVPLTVVFAIGAGTATRILRDRWVRLAAAPYAFLIVFGATQVFGTHFTRATDERWAWYGLELGSLLGDAFEDRDPLLAVSAAGAIPYASELRSLDLLGLCDAHIARTPPADFGSGPLAHELGDPDYVLRRQPDLLVMGPPGPGQGLQFGGRYGPAFYEDPRFANHYRPVRIEVPTTGRYVDGPFDAYVWIRFTDGALGVDFDGSRLVIPAWFLRREERALRSDEKGRLHAVLEAEETWSVTLPTPSRPIASVHVEGEGAGVSVSRVVTPNGLTTLEVHATQPSRVDAVVVELD